jgi:hypothetical protein
MAAFFFCSFVMHHFIDLDKSDSLEYGKTLTHESETVPQSADIESSVTIE